MDVVFWTGCINFHTINMFNCFGEQNTVIIAYCERSFRGYTDLSVPNCELVELSSEDDVATLVERTKTYIHINNGFKTQPQHKLIRDALKMLCKRNVLLVSLFQEQFPYKGFIGFLRQLKWTYIYNWGLGRKHKLIGYCGEKAYISLRKALLPKSKLIEFIYTPWYDNRYVVEVNRTVTFVMVGQLVPRKCVLETIGVLKDLSYNFYFKIVGDGILKNKVLSLIGDDSRFEYLGTLTPADVQKEYLSSDYLILSSKFDGWGCSVNEALSQGCRVVVSDNCGSESLVRQNPFLGMVYRTDYWDEFKAIIEDCIKTGPLTLEQKHKIIEWSLKISPSMESEYLTGILMALQGSTKMPKAPWN